jgi:hypothetical protein
MSVPNVFFPAVTLVAGGDALALRKHWVKPSVMPLYRVPMTAGLPWPGRLRLIYGGGAFGLFRGFYGIVLRFVSLGMPGYAVQMNPERAYFADRTG